MTEDSTKTEFDLSAYMTPCYSVGRYTYSREIDGVDELWSIEGPGVPYLDGVRFWDDADGTRAEAARVDARRMTYAYALLDVLKDVLAAAAEVPPSAWTPRFKEAVNAAAALAESAEEGVRP